MLRETITASRRCCSELPGDCFSESKSLRNPARKENSKCQRHSEIIEVVNLQPFEFKNLETGSSIPDLWILHFFFPRIFKFSRRQSAWKPYKLSWPRYYLQFLLATPCRPQFTWGLEEKYIRARAFARMRKVGKAKAISSRAPPAIAFLLRSLLLPSFCFCVDFADNRQWNRFNGKSAKMKEKLNSYVFYKSLLDRRVFAFLCIDDRISKIRKIARNRKIKSWNFSREKNHLFSTYVDSYNFYGITLKTPSARICFLSVSHTGPFNEDLMRSLKGSIRIKN